MSYELFWHKIQLDYDRSVHSSTVTIPLQDINIDTL